MAHQQGWLASRCALRCRAVGAVGAVGLVRSVERVERARFPAGPATSTRTRGTL
jgi:hypothetical protein